MMQIPVFWNMSILKMQAAVSSETFVLRYQTTLMSYSRRLESSTHIGTLPVAMAVQM
jgi:hypothetical protein